MHYTIYFNQKPLRLADSKIDFLHLPDKQPGFLYQDQLSKKGVQDIIKGMQEPKTTEGLFIHPDAEALLEAFKKELTVIVAGGGLVHTDENTILLIFRKGKWDLPKGKLDKNETPAAAALREVQEETGLTDLTLQEPLMTTYHTYYEKENFILKESHWFLMKSPQQEAMKPQLEEDIEKCEWVKWDRLGPYLENTHPSLKDVLKAGMEKLNTRKTF